MKLQKVEKVLGRLLKHFPEARMKNDNNRLRVILGVDKLSIFDIVKIRFLALSSTYKIEQYNKKVSVLFYS